MTSELPYRAARSPEAALDELRRCAGTQFDAEHPVAQTRGRFDDDIASHRVAD